MVEIRRLPAESLTLLFQIDRSERVEVHHIVEDGELRSEAVDWHVPNWNPEGDGPYSVGGLLADLRPILGRGGVLLGVFRRRPGGRHRRRRDRFRAFADMAGVPPREPARRRSGVASRLWDETVRLARAAGDESIYVSATPSESAVGFNLSRGCKLADPPQLQLQALEPEDVHFVCRLES